MTRKVALIAHCKYQQAGGEDTSFEANLSAMESLGVEVHKVQFDNSAIRDLNRWELLKHSFSNSGACRQVFDICSSKKVDVFHCHNSFPLASPSLHSAAKAAGARTVQWLHNYRLLCPAATLLRENKICEDCLGRPFAWPGVLHRCYRNSFIASLGSASIVSAHRHWGAYKNSVDRYVALTEFGRKKFIAGGLPPEKLRVIPNHLHPDPGAGDGDGDFCMFVGRLSEEKGLRVLIGAIQACEQPVRLKVFGTGPLENLVRDAALASSRIEYCGQATSKQILGELKNAKSLVFPSIWYEGLPRTIIEAFAVGTPVISTNIGAMSDLIAHEVNGLHFALGSVDDMAGMIDRLWEDGSLRMSLRNGARQTYLSNYTLLAVQNPLWNVSFG